LIKGFPPGFPGTILFYLKPSALQIQLQYLAAGFYLDVVFLPGNFRCPGDQRSLLIDDPADVVGNASGCIRDVRSGFKYSDVQVPSAPPGLRSGAHSCCISSDNHQPL